MKITPTAPAGIDAPSGIQFTPASVGPAAGDDVLFCPVWKDDRGTPDRIVVVTVQSTSVLSIVTFSRHGDAWVFDSSVDCTDFAVTLTKTAAAQANINAFAIESPGTATDPILFVSTNDASQTPDTFEMDSIQLPDGATSLTATTVTIAGGNQPADTNSMATVSLALSTSRAMTFFQDDAHFADITGNESGFTFTYNDAKVLAVDTSIVAAKTYSGFLVGSQVVLYKGGGVSDANAMWEMSTAAALTEEFNAFSAGLAGSIQDVDDKHHSRITAIGGQFAIAAPVGGSGDAGDECAYIVVTFPLDDI